MCIFNSNSLLSFKEDIIFCQDCNFLVIYPSWTPKYQGTVLKYNVIWCIVLVGRTLEWILSCPNIFELFEDGSHTTTFELYQLKFCSKIHKLHPLVVFNFYRKTLMLSWIIVRWEGSQVNYFPGFWIKHRGLGLCADQLYSNFKAT